LTVIPPVNIGRRDPITLRSTGAAKGGPAGAAAHAMTQVAGRVASAMTAQFGLAEVDPRGGYTGGNASDAYGVEEMAGELTAALGGGPKERGDIARSLHEFVREGATLVAARPESRSLERLEAAIADASIRPPGSGSDVQQAIAAIDDAVLRLQGTGR
jgi:hypothetical protein